MIGPISENVNKQGRSIRRHKIQAQKYMKWVIETFENLGGSQAWWFTPIISDAQKTEMGELLCKADPDKKCETLSEK
jgi:hypothetical protein